MNNTRFSFLNREYTLVRYPEQHQHKSLQAWDSADELLINYTHTHIDKLEEQHLVLINDEFGALGCWFAEYKPTWITDSHIATLSLKTNLSLNGINWIADNGEHLQAPLKTQSVQSPILSAPDLILLKIPRTLGLLEQQLIEISSVIHPQTKIIAAGKVKTITKNVLALFEKYIGVTTTSLATKKSRLIFSQPSRSESYDSPSTSVTKEWPVTLPSGRKISVTNYANVFSRQSLDIGARFMLEHMQVLPKERVIDLGCGNGILGLNALDMAPDSEVTFVDESYMALASAQYNVKTAYPDSHKNCKFIASNCLETLIENNAPKVNRILCNPPFHQQNTITDHIAWQMFHDSFEMLLPGGHLIVVANRHLDYYAKLKRLFGGVNLIASQNKFVILSAAKR